MNDMQRQALLIEAHTLIEEQAERTAAGLCGQGGLDLDYPPGGEWTDGESAALERLSEIDDPHLESALRKAASDAAAAVLVRLFDLIDGAQSPAGYRGEWGVFSFTEAQEAHAAGGQLHDEFFETYREWRRHRGRSPSRSGDRDDE